MNTSVCSNPIPPLLSHTTHGLGSRDWELALCNPYSPLCPTHKQNAASFCRSSTQNSQPPPCLPPPLVHTDARGQTDGSPNGNRRGGGERTRGEQGGRDHIDENLQARPVRQQGSLCEHAWGQCQRQLAPHLPPSVCLLLIGHRLPVTPQCHRNAEACAGLYGFTFGAQPAGQSTS